MSTFAPFRTFADGSLRSTQRRIGQARFLLCGMAQQIAVEIVLLYSYVEYMNYLLAGSVALAMYVAVMIGGGMLLLMMGPRTAPCLAS